jgi:hypothetical protein
MAQHAKGHGTYKRCWTDEVGNNNLGKPSWLRCYGSMNNKHARSQGPANKLRVNFIC